MPGKRLNSQAQELVLNLLEYFELEKRNGGPLEPISSVQERVAAALNKKENVYIIDELLREHGHEVLRLPPYNCEFNAVELIWANCKSYYNKYIGKDGYSDSSVINMWKEALEQCNPQIWEKCVRHTHEIIQKWYAREQNIDDIGIQPILININAGDSFDSEYEEN